MTKSRVKIQKYKNSIQQISNNNFTMQKKNIKNKKRK